MNDDTLFSAGFDWSDDVASGATRVEAAARSPNASSRPALSQPVATHDATPGSALFSGDFGWSPDAVASVASVAETEGQRLERLLSQPITPVLATPPATLEMADFCGFEGGAAPAVAGVASVAAWREGVELLSRSRCPQTVDPRRWRELVADARALLQNWGAELLGFGWTTLEVFGVNRDPRHRRLDIPGLLPVLRGRPVVAVDRDTATIRANRADLQTFQRQLVFRGGLPVWGWVEGAHQ